MEAEKLIGAIASALNLDATELLTELKDGEGWASNAESTLSDRMKAQVKAVKEEQRKRGIKEKATAVEKFFKAKGFDNPERLEGDAMLDAAFEQLAQKQEGGEPGKLTPAELAKLPEVKALIEEGKQNAAKAYDALKAEYEQAKTGYQRDRVKDLAAAKIPSILDAGKIVLDVPGVEGSKDKRIKALFNLLDWSEVGVNDKGDLIYINQDGTQKTDDFGKPVDFQKSIVSMASEIYGVQKVDPSKSGANPAGSGAAGAGGAGRVYTFANAAEFSAAVMAEADPAKRSQMRKDYSEQAAQQ